VQELQTEMDRFAAEAREQVEAVHRSYRKELVILPDPGEVIVLASARRPAR